MSKLADLDEESIRTCHKIVEGYNDLIKAWTLPVIHALGLRAPARFNELKRRIAGISATSLAERLSELEEKGIIERRVLPERPVRVEYTFTEKGWELYRILNELAEWIKKYHISP
ncbi:MAG: helix-turn-helix domain-containing protein [Thermoprotei archaeon]